MRDEGFYHNNKHYTVKINAVIVDTVARNWLMCFPPHNAYQGCAKCKEKGTKKGGRMLFLESNAPLRDDISFREDVPSNFRNTVSPIKMIGIGMVSQIPLDSMHLLYSNKETLTSLVN